jgi:hypothetical protein
MKDEALPFGVGGGLVAVKTLLSRDPCVHANTAIEMIDAILKEHPVARPAVQEPVALLANGTRFKISYDSRQSGGQIHGIPPELGGRWVAFVAADDDCHLKLTTPPAAQRTWVRFDDDEFDYIFARANPHCNELAFARAIEAKVFEKNGATGVTVPDALNPKDENPAYAAGWNDCRAEMLKGMKP